MITGETGLVIAPILPGDSLLFAAGTFAARGDLNVWILFLSLSVAAVLGDALNYTVGRYLGPKFFRKEGDGTRFFKKENLDRTHDFFEKYGPATIIIARFLPIVRTFAPFVAGMGRMAYPRFLAYNVDRRHRLGGLVHLRRLLLRQHPLRPEPLPAGHPRHRAGLPGPHGGRGHPAPAQGDPGGGCRGGRARRSKRSDRGAAPRRGYPAPSRQSASSTSRMRRAIRSAPAPV